MIPSIFITDDAGKLLYKDREDPIPTAFVRLLRRTEPLHGLIRADGCAYFAKTVVIEGRDYRFFLEYDRLCALYGSDAAAERAANGLLNLHSLGSAPRQPMTLASLLYLFYENCPDALRARWMKPFFPGQITASVPPSGFALALSLIICMTTGSVALAVVQDGGRLTVLCNGKINREIELPFFRAFLREVCGECGFGISMVERGEECRCFLDLEPLDPAKLGLKADALPSENKNFAAYGAWFCG